MPLLALCFQNLHSEPAHVGAATVGQLLDWPCPWQSDWWGGVRCVLDAPRKTMELSRAGGCRGCSQA